MSNVPIISFPCGAAGNHLRWLLFLDKSMHNPFTNGQTIDDKLNFIKEKVYNQNRSWNTWLHIESQYRTKLSEQIEVRHELYDWEVNKEYTARKIVFLKADDVDTTVAHYFHINLGMNSTTPCQSIKKTHNWNSELDVMIDNHKKLDNWLVIDPKLFEKKLDQDRYKTIINFLGFDNHYDQAALVHSWYCASREKSARDFYKYFTSTEFNGYMEFLKNIAWPND